jgi:toxin HigB-1
VNISFKNKKLGSSLTNDKEILYTYGDQAKKIKQRMQELKAAENLETIAKLQAMRLHPYKGNRKGEWSVDIYKNWRIIFEIDHNPLPLLDAGGVDLRKVTDIKIVSVEDPH